MTSSPSPPSLELDLEVEYPEKARAIRQSLRCLAVGVLACVPPFVLVLPWVGIDLFHRVCRVTGERWRWGSLSAVQWSLGMAAGWFLRTRQWAPVGAILLSGSLLILVWVLVRYACNRPLRWNPARPEAYLGFALSMVGGLMLATVVGALVLNALLAMAKSIWGL